MKMHLTPEMLEATYDLLKTTPPFRSWKLPDADDITFEVSRAHDVSGQYLLRDGKNVIQISSHCVGRLATLLMVMAHEMIHLREEVFYRSRADIKHGARFKRLAKQVCTIHGFEEAIF
jgi:predicted SprT family Zn-dependent metalloprotease